MAKAKFYTSIIKGHEWKFYAQSTNAYKRAHGSDSHAITYYKDREVFFQLTSLSPNYVRHELVHCYIASSSINSSSLTADQMEELAAELIGEHGPEMFPLAQPHKWDKPFPQAS